MPTGEPPKRITFNMDIFSDGPLYTQETQRRLADTLAQSLDRAILFGDVANGPRQYIATIDAGEMRPLRWHERGVWFRVRRFNLRGWWYEARVWFAEKVLRLDMEGDYYDD